MTPLVRDVYRALLGAFLLIGVVVGCASLQSAPEITTRVRTVPTSFATPVACVDAKDIPPKFETAMQAPSKAPAGKSLVGVNANGASADVHRLKTEHEKMRALLNNCVEAPK